MLLIITQLLSAHVAHLTDFIGTVAFHTTASPRKQVFSVTISNFMRYVKDIFWFFC
ncbi:hypothetical protein HMPREF1141_1383 [Clostridium sp. MSTE9]|nr:hypothetical protein HMPREF1141_1383 [Clostridium sp. MSTE9]